MEVVLFMFPLRRRHVARLSLITFAGLLAGAAQAADDGTVVITATRTPARASEVVAEVSVIDRAALDRAPGRTLAELLAGYAGIQFSSNGGLGKTASLFMRGLEARHTLLLVDGVRVGSATVGSPSLDNLPLEAVERIEIVRGPMSSLYGNGAMGGVIQVFLRRGGQGVTANAKATAGSHGYGQLAAGATFGDGRIDAAAQLQRTEVTGVSATNPGVPFGSHNPDDDGFRQTGGSLRLGWQPLADWRVELLALQSRGTTQIDDGPGADARARLKNDIVALSGSGRVAAGWRTRVGVAESTDGYDTLSSASAFASLGLIQSKIRQISWENTLATPLGTALLLLERQTEKVSRPEEAFTVSERDIDALAVGLNGAAGPHVWNASLRRDRNSQFGTKSTGAAGYGYALTPSWRVLGSYGTSFVAPSFNQLYFPNFGNPLLEAETGKHAEIGLRYSAGDTALRAAWYEHRYRGFITSGAAPQNLPYAKITGLTLAYEGRWRELALSAALDHTDPRNDTVGSANYDKQLPRRAKDMLRLGADWSGGPWSAGATLAAFSHRYDNAANTVRLGGYATLDLRAEWAATRDWALGLKLNNLGDQRYETSLGYDQPGREAFVTARYTLK
jgi:vitamin B12 transporter